MMVSTYWNRPSVYNHEPPDYSCPFCAVAAGQEIESVYTGDELYIRTAERYLTTPSQRRPYAEKLKAALANLK